METVAVATPHVNDIYLREPCIIFTQSRKGKPTQRGKEENRVKQKAYNIWAPLRVTPGAFA